MPPAETLIERELPLTQLRERMAALAAQGGSVVVLSGEAGIGKTSLLEALREGSGPRADAVAPAMKSRLSPTLSSSIAPLPPLQWLVGRCEPLLAPPPYLPLADMLHALPREAAALLRGGGGGVALMAELLSFLRERATPLVLVVDDAHWADSATIELLRYLARRIAGTRALLIVSHRTPLAPDHALLALLGALPPAHTLRIELAPLSPQGVAALARGQPMPPGLFEATGGNPFLVSACLASPTAEADAAGAAPAAAPPASAATPAAVPAAVLDAVRAQAMALPAAAREALALVSVAPAGLETELLEAVLEDAAMALDTAARAALLVADGATWRFRHDIARQAYEATLGDEERVALHAAIFDALDSAGSVAARTGARRVHHAERARLSAAVLRLAPLAAFEAAAAGAQRQAADLLGLALQHAQTVTPPLDAATRLQLLTRQAEALAACDRLLDAIASRSAAVALLRGVVRGDEDETAARAGAGVARGVELGAGPPHIDTLADPRLELGRQLRELARLRWLAGQLPQGQAEAQEAVSWLEQVDAPLELALAHATLAQSWLIDDAVRSLRWGRLALARLTPESHPPGHAHALNTVGFAQLVLGGEEAGWAALDESLERARTLDDSALIARAYANLASMCCVQRQWARLGTVCEQGIAFASARDLDRTQAVLRIRRAFGAIEQGRWAAARAELRLVQAMPLLPPLQDRQSKYLLALLDLREGVEGASAHWAGLLAGQGRMAVDPWYAPQALAWAEAAWLLGDEAALEHMLAEALPQALAAGERWRIGQLLCWQRRLRPAGAVRALPAGLPLPCVLELRGDIDAAAAAWAALGCRHAQALTLLAGPAASATRGLALLAELGAAGSLRVLRPRLAAAGQRLLPRGPNRRTRQDPLGLTARERQILELLAEGLPNRGIAARLSRSERTVEHHVAALLAKLGVGCREDAVRRLNESASGPPTRAK